MKRLPPPRAGHYSITRARRVPMLPVIYSAAILDGSVLLALVYGLTGDQACERATREALSNGYPASALRVALPTGWPREG